MTSQLLRKLCCLDLPVYVNDQLLIAQCDLLCRAGLIEADIPSLSRDSLNKYYCGQAIVMRVTNAGLAARHENQVISSEKIF